MCEGTESCGGVQIFLVTFTKSHYPFRARGPENEGPSTVGAIFVHGVPENEAPSTVEALFVHGGHR